MLTFAKGLSLPNDAVTQKFAFLGRTGCHRLGQLVMLYSGELVPVEHVQVGDRLMGPDSKPRTVLRLCRGTGQMIEVIPVKGAPFVVNDQHILVTTRTRYSAKKRDLQTGQLFDIPIATAMAWGRRQWNLNKLVRVAVDFPTLRRSLPMDPYHLGILLGDGMLHHRVSICTPDPEVRRAFYALAKIFGVKVRVETSTAQGKAKGYSLTIGRKTGRNPAITMLRQLGLWGTKAGDKFIPEQFKTAARRERLQLLAGLIDTDGHLQGNCYDYISKSRRLADDVAFMARSVGLAAQVHPCRKSAHEGHEDTYYRMSISGEIGIIPCKVPRRVARPRKQIKNVLRTGFSLRKLKRECFFGFTLSGDGRYLLGDFTVTHNSGKSYAAKRFVESLLAMRAPTVIIDCVGIWHGLRLGTKSFPIPVLGGIHGDIDLPDTAGALVADLVCDKNLSAVIDVSQFLDTQRTRFVEAFGRQLFQRKKMAPSAMHLVLEEAQEIVPQNPQPGEQMMLHEFQRIAKLGRNFGIGLSLISQRPQEVSKKALNQSECVLAFQMTGPQERKALEYWLSDRGVATEQNLAKLLPSLEVGKPFIWSPQWLKVSTVVEILPIETLDSSQTPSVGSVASTLEMSKIDLTELHQSFQAVVTEAKENDPKALRARITELEKLLAKGDTISFQFPPDERKNAEALTLRAKAHGTNLTRLLDGTSEQLKLTEQALGDLGALLHQAKELAGADDLVVSLQGFFQRISTLGSSLHGATGAAVAPEPRRARRPPAPLPEAIQPKPAVTLKQKARAAREGRLTESGTTLQRVDALLLQVLAQHGAMSRTRASVLAGYPPGASTTRNAVGRLRTAGYIEGENAQISITALGLKNTAPFEKLPKSKKERLAWWVSQLPAVDGAMLQALVARYPNAYTLEQVSGAAGYEYGKSTTRNAAGRLRTLGLVEGSNNGMMATKDLCQ